MKRLILLGPPGSGKGTEAVRITEKYGTPQISTGDIFRKNIADGTELGAKAKSYMDAGELVPDSLVLDLVVDRLSQDDVKDGYILDGFPRTIAQAEALDKILAEKGEELNYVISLDVADEVLIQRVTSRRVCKQCSKVYNTITDPPAAEGVCDVCGGEVVQRADDSEETEKNRLAVYAEQTLPLVDYYRGKGLLSELDGEGSADEVFARIVQILG
jgi:adenylate kinase